MAGYTKNTDGGYSVNYDDQRFLDVKNEQVQQEAQLNQTYNNIINNSDQYYENQINAAKDYANQQSELQQAQTDFAIQKLEQQKDQAQKDYTKEQKASYVDYMKQTKSNAQNMANSGLNNTGYSESSLVSMYNQYQNRVGSAKESLNQSILNYNNSMQQAILANNEKLAEIAYNSLQTQNQLNQQAFEYKNAMILQREQALQNVNDTYYARYQNVLAQINNEIELQMALDKIDREYDQWLAEYNASREQWWANYNLEQQKWQEQMRQYDIQQQQWEREFALKKQQSSANSNPYTSTETSNASNNSTEIMNGYKEAIQSNIDLLKTSTNTSNQNRLKENIRKLNDSIESLYNQGKISKSQAFELYALTSPYLTTSVGSGGGGGR